MTVIRAAKVSTRTELRDGWVLFCPGCRDEHAISDAWTFDGNLDAPTISPSLLVDYGNVAGVRKVCHSFVVAGSWQFLPDSTHELSGKTVPMVPFPEESR